MADQQTGRHERHCTAGVGIFDAMWPEWLTARQRRGPRPIRGRSAQVALRYPVPRAMTRAMPRATRYQMKTVIGWCATNLSSHAMAA